jgi:dihydrofolate reductase
VIVAAVAENGVIGRDNSLPWRLKSDMQHFRALTLGKPVIMGRKTFQSLGKPLKERTNIVVSRDPNFAGAGIVVAPSLDDALSAARGDALRRGADAIAIIGGHDVFSRAFPVVDVLEITHVHAKPAGDTFFPPIDATIWREVSREDHPAGPVDEAAFTFATYQRRPVGSAPDSSLS